MSTLYKYRLTSNVGDIFELWAEEEPTSWPLNNIDTIDSVVIIDEQRFEVVQIREAQGLTGGHFQTMTKKIPGVADSTTITDFIWKRPISITSIHFQSTIEHQNDIISVIVSPDTIIGALISAASINDDVLFVSSTVVQYLKIGYMVTLSDDNNTFDCGEVISLGANTITIENPLTINFASASLIKMSIVPVKNLEIGPPSQYSIGLSVMNGSDIPSNTIIRVKYVKNNSNNTPLICRLETMY